MSKYVLPELPTGFYWTAEYRNKKKEDVVVVMTKAHVCCAAVVDNNSIEVWKNEGGGGWVVAGQGETLQQALNMAAALVALGEADE